MIKIEPRGKKKTIAPLPLTSNPNENIQRKENKRERKSRQETTEYNSVPNIKNKPFCCRKNKHKQGKYKLTPLHINPSSHDPKTKTSILFSSTPIIFLQTI